MVDQPSNSQTTKRNYLTEDCDELDRRAAAKNQTTIYHCPHCKNQILSPGAAAVLAYMKRVAPPRGGYMFEGARPAFESGEYHDAKLAELLAVGAIAPHDDPAKGWVAKW